jgi:hypothetical protein
MTIVHQIPADDGYGGTAFSHFQADKTIPSLDKSVTSSHPDNLFALCANCREGYDAAFPDWVLIPDEETLHKYIDHEKNDYEQRYLVSQKSHSVPLVLSHSLTGATFSTIL